LYGLGPTIEGVPVNGFKPSSTDHELLPAGTDVVGLVLITTGKGIDVCTAAVAGRYPPTKVDVFEPVEIKVKQYRWHKANSVPIDLCSNGVAVEPTSTCTCDISYQSPVPASGRPSKPTVTAILLVFVGTVYVLVIFVHVVGKDP
jgi:hypothetical protein